MCTLVIATRVAGAPPLFVIANRDEQLGRPADGPAIVRRGGRRILAPRDREAGGTWLGLNDRGLFAGLTNRFGLTSRPDHRSRGHIVFDALREETAESAARRVAAMDPDRHNGFHLVVADADGARVVVSDTDEIASVGLRPGFYAVTERSFGAGQSARVRRMNRRLAGLDRWSESTRDRLRGWMAEHRDNPMESTCVHATDHDYGTRSSTIVEVGDRWRFAHADGPPCSTDYREYGDEIAELRVG